MPLPPITSTALLCIPARRAISTDHKKWSPAQVTIYRLITRSTYEQTLIETANHKSGLNEAILGSTHLDGNPEDNAKRIAALLRDGANVLQAGEGESAECAAQFQQQDIGEILAQRTSKRTIASKAGGTFSTAVFQARSEDGGGGRKVEDANFWSDLLPEAVKAHQEAERNKHLVEGKRKRKAVSYFDSDQDQVRPGSTPCALCTCSFPVAIACTPQPF